VNKKYGEDIHKCSSCRTTKCTLVNEEDGEDGEDMQKYSSCKTVKWNNLTSNKPYYIAFGILSIVFILQSVSMIITKVLWPLSIHDHFGWTYKEYSCIIFFSSLVSISTVAYFPIMEKRVGSFNLVIISVILVAFFGTIEFNFHGK